MHTHSPGSLPPRRYASDSFVLSCIQATTRMVSATVEVLYSWRWLSCRHSIAEPAWHGLAWVLHILTYIMYVGVYIQTYRLPYVHAWE